MKEIFACFFVFNCDNITLYHIEKPQLKILYLSSIGPTQNKFFFFIYFLRIIPRINQRFSGTWTRRPDIELLGFPGTESELLVFHWTPNLNLLKLFSYHPKILHRSNLSFLVWHLDIHGENFFELVSDVDGTIKHEYVVYSWSQNYV